MLNEFVLKFRPFDKVECCFDIVAVFGNIVAGFGNNVAVFGNSVAKNGNNVGATFDFVEKIVRLIALDNVASTLLLVWTGLKLTTLATVDVS